MARSVLVVGTLDTKGDQVLYLKEQIEGRGMMTEVMDAGVIGAPSFPPDIAKETVAKAAGTTIEKLIDMADAKSSMDVQAQGACKIIKELCSREEINGILVLGGSMGTALALELIKAVPWGVPKIVISTVAYSSALIPDMVGGHDVMMLPWTAGLWGINDLSRQVLETAAGAITGAADAFDKKQVTEKKVAGATSLGAVATHYMKWLKPALESRGYEVAVYHATGMSGRMYERTIRDGFISASLDLAAGVELVNQAAGSSFGAGEHRLEAAGERGIPQIISLGGIETFHWGPDKPIPPGLNERFLIWHNSLLAMIRTAPGLCAEVGKMMAKQVNKAKGPTAVVLPMRGSLPKDSPPDTDVHPDGFRMEIMTALRDAMMKDIRSDIEVVELDLSYNEPRFADAILEIFDQMMK